MKVLFDTNIVVDILAKRMPFYESSNKVLMLAVDDKIEGIIGTNTITDIYYLTRKHFSDTKTAVDIILDTLEIIKPIDTLVDDIYKAAKLGFRDFEDAVIAAIAIRENAEYIITRNIRDFTQSVIPAITPDDFLTKVVVDTE
jgi:predicted nucleic acid-binding protein